MVEEEEEEGRPLMSEVLEGSAGAGKCIRPIRTLTTPAVVHSNRSSSASDMPLLSGSYPPLGGLENQSLRNDSKAQHRCSSPPWHHQQPL